MLVASPARWYAPSGAGLAQLVEHPPCKREVAGSIPAAGTKSGSKREEWQVSLQIA